MVAQGADAYHRAKALFLEALEKPDDQRAAFVEQECGQDQGLCEEVMAFLKAHQASEPDALNGDRDDAETFKLPDIEIPGYEIVRRLSEGGQGVVFLAVQASTKRKVAIKILQAGPLASRSAKRRFHREVELVAQLKHPNIITIFDLGTTSGGFQYCVMD